ncbi:ankyrin repeat-containing domain protein [Aspergillus pseudotamarii]|uniref:Ankyrin repeat-containing domain protein n=1 Tax=Aspergillus pseudotamarii TaxID=132259 RepID=A0A5N6SZU8_ASPPS|nr:ankyrin repeat-containing domain protein [Aspergillus pseudotamarii]KAE8138654.1 ankyrin repeat-containing domain protein [Aspergillus pseudotamarii]
MTDLWELIDVTAIEQAAIRALSKARLRELFLWNNFYVFESDREWREWRNENYFRQLEEQNNLRRPLVYRHDDPVTHCIALDREDRLQFMLECGLPPECWTKTGWSPLGVAVHYKADRCFNLLCAAQPEDDILRQDTGILPSAPNWLMTFVGERAYTYGFSRLLDHFDHYNETQQHRIELPPISPQAVYHVVRVFPVPLIERAAHAGLRLALASHQATQEGAWHIAPIRPDAMDLINVLCRECAAGLSSYDAYSRTPLFQAVESGKPDVVKIYIGHGVDVGHIDVRADTALHVACKQRPVNLQILQQLLGLIDLNSSAGSAQGTPLHTLLSSTWEHTWNSIPWASITSPNGITYGRKRKRVRPLSAEEKMIMDVACEACSKILELYPDQQAVNGDGQTALKLARVLRLRRLSSRILGAARKAERRWDRRLRPRIRY